MVARRSRGKTPLPGQAPSAIKEDAQISITAKYPRPKILVIDAPDIQSALTQKGYTAASGTFGRPMIAPPESGYIAIRSTAELPGHTEQQVVIADLIGPEAEPTKTKSSEPPPPGVRTLWAPLDHGLVDPRPAAMLGVRADMDRILKHGGIFILFAAPRSNPRYKVAELTSYGSLDPYSAQEMHADNWSLLTDLRWLPISADSGEEMDPADNGVPRKLGIDRYFNDGRFECTISPGPLSDRWITLATNKYADPVSGMVLPEKGEEQTAGLIFIFPGLKRRAELVIDLMENVLPEFRPRLFPHAEGTRWTRRPEYDFPQVITLKSQITQVEEEARIQTRKLEEEIKRERAKYGFLHDLLTASGETLVQAVAKTLKMLGFNEVRDADAEAKRRGENVQLREDLQIMDASVPVLVEIKGIAGTPKEASALQVAKYLIPRMREWGRTDLCGLAIVNHQRNLPALEREHEHVFQTDVISNAEQQKFGLLTTWDLFRLARGFILHGWRHEDIADLFTSPGRIHPIPSHYEYVGLVDEYWPGASALGLRLESGILHVGDRVAYEQPVDFIEEGITSLQVDNQSVEEVEAGSYVGIKTSLTKQQARKGTKVYRIRVTV